MVQRLSLPAAPDGSHRVEVVNKAAIRVLAWKFWSCNRVVYRIAPRQAAGAETVQVQCCACGGQPALAQQSISSSGGASQACIHCSQAQEGSSSLQEVPRTVCFNLLSSVSSSTAELVHTPAACRQRSCDAHAHVAGLAQVAQQHAQQRRQGSCHAYHSWLYLTSPGQLP